MSEDYRKKYLKIYFWQILAFSLNFLSMFVVTPLITNMPVVFGIYSVCISLNIFLNYADLGFLMAGEKFATEAYSKNDFRSECTYLGTSIFVYAVMSILVVLFVLVCIINPSFIIKDVGNDISQIEIARELLIILAFSIPITILRKYVASIFRIRLEDYKVQRINIVGSLIVILSVPLVFFNNRYDIVGYYLFSQVILLLICIYNLMQSRKIGYGFNNIITSIRFNKEKFAGMKGLASSGFVGSISWMLCYEMDLILISTMLGAQMVALYAIGRNLNNLLRSIFGIIYSPYSVRFNYFVGKDDIDGLKEFYYKLIRIFSYLTVIPIVVFLVFAKPFVIAWVGEEYVGAVLVVQILVFCFLPNYFTAPAGAVVIALNKFKSILIVSILMPLAFYGGLFSLIWFFGINAVAFSKWIVAVISGGYYVILVCKLFGDNLLMFIKEIKLLGLVVPIFLLLLLGYLASTLVQDVVKSPLDLMKVVLIMGSITLVSLLSVFAVDKGFRKEFLSLISMKR